MGFEPLHNISSNGEDHIGFEIDLFPGMYFVTIRGIPTSNSWRFPYLYHFGFLPSPPLAPAFSADLQEGCVPFAVNFSNQTMGNELEYSWVFEGGNPSVSDEPNPTVVYDEPGIYPVSLTVGNIFEEADVSEFEFILADGTPIPGFSISGPEGSTFNFMNQTQFVGSEPNYFWDFGDAQNSSEASPMHSYINPGTFEVILTASNSCGSFTTSETLEIMTVSTEENRNGSLFSVFPNPTSGEFILEINGEHIGPYQLFLFNIIGENIQKIEGYKSGGTMILEMDLSPFPNGTYIIRLNSEKENFRYKIVKN